MAEETMKDFEKEFEESYKNYGYKRRSGMVKVDVWKDVKLKRQLQRLRLQEVVKGMYLIFLDEVSIYSGKSVINTVCRESWWVPRVSVLRLLYHIRAC